MARLILVRHGQSEGNRIRMFAEDPQALQLTALGYQQAAAAAQRIRALFRVELVVCSPYLRASETARIIAETVQAPLQVEPNLHERNVGQHQGQSYDSIYQAPDYERSRHFSWRPPGGESYEDVAARVGPVFDRLAAANADRDVVIVSHGGVMLALWSHAVGAWEGAWAAPNCGVVLIEHNARGYARPVIIGEDCTAADDTGG